MATTTVTPDVAAETEPTTQAAAKPEGRLASILTPVEPARPVTPIGSTASMAEESIATTDSKPGKQTEKNSGPVREHPVGALVRAIAARIGRPSRSSHVKRQHTITESRVSGHTGTTTHANRSSQDGRNHQIGQHRTARDQKVADNNSKINQGRDQRDVKAHDSKTSTGTTSAKQDHASKNGATTNKQDVMHQTSRDGLDGRPGNAPAKDGKSTSTTKDATTAPTKGATAAKDQAAQKPSPAPKDAAAAKETPAKTDATAKASTNTTKTPGAAPQPRPRTQSSREAGYHDGTRAAKVTNHVKAYRDGVQDGYADGTAEYEQEKRRMDDAKARNAVKPTGQAKPDMQPASGSTVDLAKKEAPADAIPAAPVQLTGISESTVSFDADGASHTLSRGEVRTLRGFERRIAAKAPVLQRVAEGSKTARKRTTEHATRAQQLAEAAKTVKGGDRLVAKLQRLAEQTQALRARTEEVEKRANRGAEAVIVLVANANTRHGGIYKAVVDSPLTSPAEREFYQDREGS